MSSPRIDNLTDSLLVVGSARSGTTWLAESLNASHEYRIIFEPFIAKFNPQWIGKPYPYVANNDTFKRKKLMRQILLGQSKNNHWTNKIHHFSLRKPGKIMVKDIRLNLMLGWIQCNFPRLKIVYIVRDPFSAAYSAEKFDIWVNNVARHYVERPKMAKLFSDDQINLVKAGETTFQMAIAKWAIENFVALKNIDRNGNIVSVFYEKLVANPETEFKKLGLFCGIDLGSKLTKRISKKSATARKDTVTSASDKMFGKSWQGEITEQDEKYANDILLAFGLDKLYSERNTPGFDEPLDLII